MPVWNSFLHFVQDMNRVTEPTERQRLADELIAQRSEWPWVEGDRAAFVYQGTDVTSVALNLDIIEADPPFVPLVNLEHTSLWYIQREFARDDLLDYLLAVNDPMTPLREEADLLGRIQAHWRVDPRNSVRMNAQIDTSILRMPQARPVPDWQSFNAVPHGRVVEHEFNSVQMNFQGRKLWVYMPPDYERMPNNEFPLLILFDGQWMVGALQVAAMVDALIKHNRIEPLVIAMLQSAPGQADRNAEYISNDKHYASMLTELLPLLQTQYRVNPVELGVGGADMGAIAAAHMALKNPAVFRHLIMISPPLGKGADQDALSAYVERFKTTRHLPARIFQSVGRYEAMARFVRPMREMATAMESRSDVAYQCVELGSGHGLVAFKSILPEALAHAFPLKQR